MPYDMLINTLHVAIHGVRAQSQWSIQYPTMYDPDMLCAMTALNACCWLCDFTGLVPKYMYVICMPCLHCPNYAECVPRIVHFCASGSRQQLCKVWYSVLYSLPTLMLVFCNVTNGLFRRRKFQLCICLCCKRHCHLSTIYGLFFVEMTGSVLLLLLLCDTSRAQFSRPTALGFLTITDDLSSYNYHMIISMIANDILAFKCCRRNRFSL